MSKDMKQKEPTGIPVDTIIVGTTRYQIVRDNEALQRRGSMTNEVIDGYCDTEEGFIVLPGKSLSPLYSGEFSADYMRKLVTHELIHAIFRNYGYNVGHSDVEETICTVMESALVPLLRQNKELIKWLSE